MVSLLLSLKYVVTCCFHPSPRSQPECARVITPLSFFKIKFSLSQGDAADSELIAINFSSEPRDAKPVALSSPAQNFKELSSRVTFCIVPVISVFLLEEPNSFASAISIPPNVACARFLLGLIMPLVVL